MTLLEFANRFRSLPDDPEDRAGWKTCIGVCQRPFGGEWTVFCGTDMALDDILEEGYTAGAFDGPEAASIRPYLPHGNRVNVPVFLLELGRLTGMTLIGKHEPGTLAGKIADAFEVVAGLPGYVQWLRRFARGAEDQYQNAADKTEYAKPLVEFPIGGEAHHNVIFAGGIGNALTAALANRVFEAKCFDGLRGKLHGLPNHALEELMRFLIDKSYQFPGPAHEDITKLADALESIGQEKEATASVIVSRKPLSDLQGDVWKILEKHTTKYDKYGSPKKCLTGDEIADTLADNGCRNQTGKSIGDVISAMREKGWTIENQRGQGYFIPKSSEITRN